ncbi:MAG: C1 family peptidase [Cytophagaceae bacterium]|jgi:C1A family cysteine protease|nr:C1 family peptidase [Cytophagaceae bacterium]
MPVRMVEDENNDSRDNNSGGGNSGGRGGGGWGGMALITLLFTALWKWPKTTITILILLGIAYFFLGSDSSNANSQSSKNGVNKGCEMKQEVFDQAEVFEPLTADRNSLPASVSLLKYAPRRSSQGRQGSCVGWASAYAARTILQSAATGIDPNSRVFSPAFLYNQIGLPGCQGSYVVDAMKNMMEVGALPLDEFPYDESSCDRKPNSTQKNQASQYLMRGYNRLTLDNDDYRIDMTAIKQNIAQGGPVVIGMAVGGTFESDEMYGSEYWIPTQEDVMSIDEFGGHAMCVIGYDDNKNGGCFQIMNSWGDQWGKDGVFWMPYRAFEKFTHEAYGLYPLAVKTEKDKNKLEVSFGLVENESREYIPLSQKDEYTFRASNQRVGTTFKIEVKNATECYTYVIGEETDLSNYVLFPYTAKHSPYCGITGARLFPKDHSMQLDDKGKLDRMAVIVSKVALDIQAINTQINAVQVKGYANKIKAALSDKLISQPDFGDGNTVRINSDQAESKCTFMVIEIPKE